MANQNRYLAKNEKQICHLRSPLSSQFSGMKSPQANLGIHSNVARPRIPVGRTYIMRPTDRAGSSIPTRRDGTGISAVRSGIRVPVVRSGARVQTVRSGTGVPAVRSGAGVPAVGSCTGVLAVRSGTRVPVVRSGTGAPVVRSGTGETVVRLGTGVPVVRSGTGVPLIRSGNRVPPVRSGTGKPAFRAHTRVPPVRSGTGIPASKFQPAVPAAQIPSFQSTNKIPGAVAPRINVRTTVPTLQNCRTSFRGGTTTKRGMPLLKNQDLSTPKYNPPNKVISQQKIKKISNRIPCNTPHKCSYSQPPNANFRNSLSITNKPSGVSAAQPLPVNMPPVYPHSSPRITSHLRSPPIPRSLIQVPLPSTMDASLFHDADVSNLMDISAPSGLEDSISFDSPRISSSESPTLAPIQPTVDACLDHMHPPRVCPVSSYPILSRPPEGSSSSPALDAQFCYGVDTSDFKNISQISAPFGLEDTFDDEIIKDDADPYLECTLNELNEIEEEERRDVEEDLRAAQDARRNYYIQQARSIPMKYHNRVI